MWFFPRSCERLGAVTATRFDGISAQMIQYFPQANFLNQRPGVNFLLTPSDTERRMTVMEKYQKGESTAAQRPPEQIVGTRSGQF